MVESLGRLLLLCFVAYRVIDYQPRHRLADDFLDIDIVTIGHLKEYLAVACGYRANEAHGVVLVAVLADVSVKEPLYLVGDEVVAVLVVEVVGEEEGVVVKVVVGVRVVIDGIHNIGTGDFVNGIELVDELPGGEVFEHVTQEDASQG